ncbi:TetR/AcrR family transcriptional regulator [Actinotalea solisilvae]|uniref:TetR/AcrR family transcriptional regulator n=1 Tax=Actinotalea solisilvae TaxID=2072922 RepID=UPI0018F1A3F4|nr:TetR/AcrR family transcriptional regulator [Actinotalea solisilvae]
MPAPSRTSRDAIVLAAGETLEVDGLDGLTMQAVAARVGVRAPSLYKHVQGRDDLVRLVTEAAVIELAGRMEAAAPEGTEPRAALHAAARALRAFGHARPGAFRLIFSPGPAATLPDPGVALRGVAVVMRVATELAGPDHALEAARTLTAWASGFIAMELAGAFRMGGDVDRAFDYGARRLADALARD